MWRVRVFWTAQPYIYWCAIHFGRRSFAVIASKGTSVVSLLAPLANYGGRSMGSGQSLARFRLPHEPALPPLQGGWSIETTR